MIIHLRDHVGLPTAIIAPDSQVQICLIGKFTVYLADRGLPASSVGSRKARTLLAMLAVHQWRLVPTDRIVEAVWGSRPPQRPLDNVATLVSRLRGTLGPEVIAGNRAGYRLGEVARVDLYDAVGLIKAAENHLAHGQAGRSLEMARQALRMLDDSALVEHQDATWAHSAVLYHGELLRRAQHAVAEAALETGRQHVAIEAAHAAIRADPFDELAYRHLMEAYDDAGETVQAIGAYQRLRHTLADELGIDPAQSTQNLLRAILQRHRGVRELHAVAQ
jgi:DNA-binding SARP family transcriptional activator